MKSVTMSPATAFPRIFGLRKWTNHSWSLQSANVFRVASARALGDGSIVLRRPMYAFVFP